MSDRATATSAGEINVQTANDRYTCMVMGMVTIGDDKLAVTDYNNNSVKIVKIKQQKVVSHIQLSYEPWDVVLISDDVLAVSTPNEQTIHFLAISVSGKLSKGRELKVDGACRGLAYYGDTLVVTFDDQPGKVQIMNLQGKVLKSIERDVHNATPVSAYLNGPGMLS